jgi:hypothetical protein
MLWTGSRAVSQSLVAVVARDPPLWTDADSVLLRPLIAQIGLFCAAGAGAGGGGDLSSARS